MFYLIRYCRLLEEGSFRGRPADFLFCLLFGGALMTAAAFFLISINFLGQCLSFMMVYLWAKRNPHVQVSLLGLVAFSAPYFPWVLLGITVLLGHDGTADILGIAVGHLYFFLADVWPAVASARGWKHCRRPFATPRILTWCCGGRARRRRDQPAAAAAGAGANNNFEIVNDAAAAPQ